MKIEYKPEDRIHIFSVSGKLMYPNDLEQIGDNLQAHEGPWCGIADLQGVTFSTAQALDLLLPIYNSARASGGDFKICHVPKKLERIINITHLRPYFFPHESQEAAKQAIKKEKKD